MIPFLERNLNMKHNFDVVLKQEEDGVAAVEWTLPLIGCLSVDLPIVEGRGNFESYKCNKEGFYIHTLFEFFQCYVR